MYGLENPQRYNKHDGASQKYTNGCEDLDIPIICIE